MVVVLENAKVEKKFVSLPAGANILDLVFHGWDAKENPLLWVVAIVNPRQPRFSYHVRKITAPAVFDPAWEKRAIFRKVIGLDLYLIFLPGHDPDEPIPGQLINPQPASRVLLCQN